MMRTMPLARLERIIKRGFFSVKSGSDCGIGLACHKGRG